MPKQTQIFFMVMFYSSVGQKQKKNSQWRENYLLIEGKVNSATVHLINLLICVLSGIQRKDTTQQKPCKDL